MILEPIKSLLRSRKFLLVVVGVVVMVAQDVFGLTPDVVTGIETLLLALIAGIAIEDAANKLNS